MYAVVEAVHMTAAIDSLARNRGHSWLMVAVRSGHQRKNPHSLSAWERPPLHRG
jgi:hypothetical protein